MKIGDFEFHYVQVPYDDRYYVVKYYKGGYGWKEIASFSPAVVNLIDDMIKLAVVKTGWCWTQSRSKQCEIFFGNKEKYDTYLDEQDEADFQKIKKREAEQSKKSKGKRK